jgi:AcrR family transcriptional regulator
MKDYSGFDASMNTQTAASLKARKAPVQSRSTATVEAVFEATIQVLLREGVDRLTTTRVAERAGVSVGTLYQYYPNKQSLLHAVLELHLEKVTFALERACLENHYRSLQTMITAVVEAFVDAKMERKEASVALYAIASKLGGETLMVKLRKRSIAALSAMLKTSPDVRIAQLDFTVLMLLSAMAGATRAVLEAGASRKMVQDLRLHLVLLGKAYLQGMAS